MGAGGRRRRLVHSFAGGSVVEAAQFMPLGQVSHPIVQNAFRLRVR
jgi:hypothetical protein